MNQDSKNQPTKLEFEIYNLPFRLRAPKEEHERLRRAAKHVDSMMRELSGSQVTPDTSKLAMQAAVLITAEYYKKIDDIAAENGLTDDVRERLNRLIQLVDEELSEL
jgi:cell division protein ZapA (FtsZ GTPase activity inhibitor)